jgi:hypothetical protein
VLTSTVEGRVRRLLGGSLASLGLAILFTAPALAGSEPTELRTFERGRLAGASDYGCQRSSDSPRVTCTGTTVDVFKGTRGGSDPEFQFRGERVCVSRTKTTFNERTGRTLSESWAQGCAENRRSVDLEFGERLTRASVDGTIRLDRIRCDREGACESDVQRVAVDLVWDAHGPVTERFIYYRETRKDCEFTFTGSERSREATVDGTIGARSVRFDGALLRHDLQQTTVCQ